MYFLSFVLNVILQHPYFRKHKRFQLQQSLTIQCMACHGDLFLISQYRSTINNQIQRLISYLLVLTFFCKTRILNKSYNYFGFGIYNKKFTKTFLLVIIFHIVDFNDSSVFERGKKT